MWNNETERGRIKVWLETLVKNCQKKLPSLQPTIQPLIIPPPPANFCKRNTLWKEKKKNPEIAKAGSFCVLSVRVRMLFCNVLWKYYWKHFFDRLTRLESNNSLKFLHTSFPLCSRVSITLFTHPKMFLFVFKLPSRFKKNPKPHLSKIPAAIVRKRWNTL